MSAVIALTILIGCVVVGAIIGVRICKEPPSVDDVIGLRGAAIFCGALVGGCFGLLCGLFLSVFILSLITH